MANQNILIAEKYLDDAKSKSKPGFFKKIRWDQVADLTKRAANYYAIEKQYDKAAYLYIQAADHYTKSNDDEYEIPACLLEAANLYKKCYQKYLDDEYLQKALSYYSMTKDSYLRMSRNHNAGDIQKNIADLYVEVKLYDDAVLAYYNAIDYYENTHYKSNIIKCYEKIFEMQINYLEKYDDAISTISSILEYYSGTDIYNRINQRKYVTDAILCSLAMDDIVRAKRILNHYNETYYHYSTTRELDFITQLIESIETSDLDQFCSIVKFFNELVTDIRIKMMLKIKSYIEDSNNISLL